MGPLCTPSPCGPLFLPDNSCPLSSTRVTDAPSQAPFVPWTLSQLRAASPDQFVSNTTDVQSFTHPSIACRSNNNISFWIGQHNAPFTATTGYCSPTIDNTLASTTPPLPDSSHPFRFGRPDTKPWSCAQPIKPGLRGALYCAGPTTSTQLNGAPPPSPGKTATHPQLKRSPQPDTAEARSRSGIHSAGGRLATRSLSPRRPHCSTTRRIPTTTVIAMLALR
jgi:hypothetical protein